MALICRHKAFLVLPPYDEVFSHNERTSLLLVNDKLRKEYENLHLDIERSKEALLKALKAQSGSKKDLEKEISAAFTPADNRFLPALLRIKDEVLRQKDASACKCENTTRYLTTRLYHF